MVAPMDATGFQLDRLIAASDDYPMRPIEDAITWVAAGSVEATADWYLVVFRSIRRADVDEPELVRHDDAAHDEAMSAPGFVHYFKGPLTVDRALSLVLPVDVTRGRPRGVGHARASGRCRVHRRRVRPLHARVLPGAEARRHARVDVRAVRPGTGRQR